MEQSLGFSHFLQHADAISRTLLILMVIMSVGTWYVIVMKTIRTVSNTRSSKVFLSKFWAAANLKQVSELISNDEINNPFARLVQNGFAAVEHHHKGRHSGLNNSGTQDEFLTRSLKRSMDEDRVQMEFGLSFVATVASSAPFIGLFGTVWGIYHALLAIGISGQGTLDKVAGPVGEALIMTAIGLVVAIPAAISYNFFSRVNRNVFAQVDSFAHDVFSFLSTGLKTENVTKGWKPNMNIDNNVSVAGAFQPKGG